MTDQPEHSPLVPTPLLGTVALEPNRWKKDPERQPSFRVSELAQTAKQVGFGGWELWDRHFLLASSEEQQALSEGDFPVVGFNSYYCPGHSPFAEEDLATKAIAAIGPQLRFVKFNLGPLGTNWDAQVEAALRWADRLPEHVRLYCECHGRTILEEPAEAARAMGIWPTEKFSAIIHPLMPDHEKLIAWWEALGPRIVHLHLQGRSENNRILAASELTERYHQAWEYLRSAGFSGTAAVEFVAGLGQPDESYEGLFQQACRDVKWLRESGLVG